MSAWIRMIQFADSTGYLRSLYERIRGPNGEIDNVMKVHSLRPHTMEGHWVLYKSVMHHADNTLPGWFHECMAVYVGLCNDCGYSIAHHFAGLKRLLKDDARANAVYAALQARAPERVFSGKELALLRYVRKLTDAPQFVSQDDIRAAREAGADDGEILEANQVCAYFNYSNRLLNGLGVSTDGEVLGLSPAASTDLELAAHR
jgi:uncharacterized peroxidase-related enzyme